MLGRGEEVTGQQPLVAEATSPSAELKDREQAAMIGGK